MISHLTQSLFVKSAGSPVTLRITVGFAQVGGSYVTQVTAAGTQEIKPNAAGDYVVTPQANSLLNCITTVQDVNASTNNTSVIHTFTNLNPPGPFTYSKAVAHQNDKVVYDISYIFI